MDSNNKQTKVLHFMAKGDRFVVLTMDKQTGNAGGLSAHIDREVYDAESDRMVPFRPKSVRDDSRTALNRECIASAKKIGRTQAIWNRLKEEGFSSESPDKKKKNGEANTDKKTRKLKKDAVIALCLVCSSDEDTMRQIEEEGRLDEWIDATVDWFRLEFGEKNVVSAVLHMDETSPHLHVTVVPITNEPPKLRKEKPKFDVNGKPVRKYETDEDGNIILDEKGRAIVKKRAYRKQEVTARLAARDICNPKAMERWQTDYANVMAPFGLRRGIVGSKQKRVPPAEWNLQQVNGELVAVEKEVEQAKADLKKWGAILIDEKTLEYPGLTKMKSNDGRTFEHLLTEAINDIITTINTPVDGMFTTQKQWRNQKVKEVKAIVTNLQTELFGNNGIDYAHKKAITAFGKDLYKEAKAVIAHTIKENEQLKTKVTELEKKNSDLQHDYKLVKKQNTELNTRITQLTAESQDYKESLEREKLAWNDDGSPVMEESGGRWHRKTRQLTNREYQKWLKEEFESKKKELVEEKLARQREREEIRREQQTHRRHMKEIKEMALAMFSLNFRKVVQIIIDHWKADLKEFARDAMEEIKRIVFGDESTTKGREQYVSDAFVWAKVFTGLEEDDSWKPDYAKLEPLREDAMRIADGTWESYRIELAWKEKRGELFDSAVAAVVEMGNNSYQKHLDQEQADAIEDFISFDGGERGELCNEIWNVAQYSIQSQWRNITHDALMELRTGELYGQSYGNGQGI